MENVLLDASDLTLPQDFDLAKDAVAFDFGDDVTIKQATGLDMRVGNYWSLSLNLGQQGKVIFTKLVETPEPATAHWACLRLRLLPQDAASVHFEFRSWNLRNRARGTRPYREGPPGGMPDGP